MRKKTTNKKRPKIQRPIPDIDLAQLTAAEREYMAKKIERMRNRRDTQFSTKFRQRDLDAWRAAAQRDKLNITDWIEIQLNMAAAEKNC